MPPLLIQPSPYSQPHLISRDKEKDNKDKNKHKHNDKDKTKTMATAAKGFANATPSTVVVLHL